MRGKRTLLLGIQVVLVIAGFVLPGGVQTKDACPETALADRQISRCVYAERLRTMWLGEALANWTGLTTEGVRQDAPFYTDADWGFDQNLDWKMDDVINFVVQDPWLSDDDTDIEYVYLHLMSEQGHPMLDAETIAAGWQAHINDWIWVSNRQARNLMETGAVPPVTGMGTINPDYLAIDAQLTTEIFGAIAPGMPDTALHLANLPILTTAGGYAAHAAQFYVLLYALAAEVDPTLPPKEQILWLVRTARQYIPDTSKTADIIDFVLADYLANPDANDWEHTRDLVYERYHRNAVENGFVYRDWTESSVNVATGLMALLYGEGDFRRTVQIGTLSGWDSDNGTATMGGLLGLMYGSDMLTAAFSRVVLTERYQIHRTRETLPDYLPDDRRAEDTFTMMAERMLPLVEQAIIDAGGRVDGDIWTLPDTSTAEPLTLNPLMQIDQQSVNNRILRAGGTITVTVDGEVAASRTRGIADGLEHHFSGEEPSRRTPRSYERMADAGELVVSVVYDREVTVHTVRMIEGLMGGDAIRAEVQVGEAWVSLPEGTVLMAQPDPAVAYQVFDFVLPVPMEISGIRVYVAGGGRLNEASVVEVDGFGGES